MDIDVPIHLLWSKNFFSAVLPMQPVYQLEIWTGIDKAFLGPSVLPSRIIIWMTYDITKVFLKKK